jgi:hypothetical protein
MAEPNPPRLHPGTMNAPVPDTPPMPTRAGRSMGVGATVLVSTLAPLALVVVDTAGGLHGWWRLLYAVPAVPFLAAGSVLVREALASGRR